ncbi:MAG TPA: outer membrane beta-barrel protein [Candidatus Nanoarchaeia archaeon]|nr:outer membrane beta-barrel protein [Candidatus Nanoarchaeia archaeon]
MSLRTKPSVVVCALALLFLAISPAMLAQEGTPPKVDIFGGYSWAAPGSLVYGTSNQGASGFGAGVTYNVNRWFGITAEVGGNYGDKFDVTRIAAGPKFTYRSERLNPFAQATFGLSRIKVAVPGTDSQNGFTALFGGGLDMPITQKVAFRLMQADYYYQHYKHQAFGLGTEKGVRLQSGIVFMLGGGEPQLPVAATCAVQPTAVMAGEPVTATVTPANFNPKRTLTFDWKATGGKVTPKDTTAAIDTTGMAPGQYTVTATVTDPRAKKNNVATCNATFTINEPPKNPPTISCSVDKGTVQSGDPANITCQVTNPDNRPLTYNWTATGGKVAGTNETGTLDTTGAPAGPITVTTTVTDDRGLSAQATTSVNVEVPPPPPQVSKLNEVAFPDKKRPGRVDNAAKAILDDVALRLQREADAKAVIVGYFDPKERGKERLAQERAVNSKRYLVDEKGIDPTRIEVRTGTAGGTRAEIYLVPAGATFNVEGTTAFDESAVKAPRKGRRR